MKKEKSKYNKITQKKNPKLKYNAKFWYRINKRDLISVDEAEHAIYNDLNILEVYTRTENMYSSKNKNNEQ